MTLIDQIKADREAGTPGPWTHRGNVSVLSEDDDTVAQAYAERLAVAKVDTRRIARVPALEAIALAAAELVDVIDEWQVSRAVGDLDLEFEKAKPVAEKRSALRNLLETDT